MANSDRLPLVAVDIGNTRIKLGVFESPLAEPLPVPTRSLAITHDWAASELDAWLNGQTSRLAWSIASVNRPAADRFLKWLADRKASSVKMLTPEDLPLVVELERPDHVGIDRLVDAVAANRLTKTQRS